MATGYLQKKCPTPPSYFNKRFINTGKKIVPKTYFKGKPVMWFERTAFQLSAQIFNYQATPSCLDLSLALSCVFLSYLSEDDILDQVNPFVQLISGVVWLLRNGEIYINESIQAECDETQKTGKIRQDSV